VFRPDPAIPYVPATREQVVGLVESINQPQVQIPGKTSQNCSGHLCGLRNPNGTFSIYVGLHLPKTGENVVYVHDRRQLSVEDYRDVEIEALHFLESMGFMLDNMNFRNLAPEVQAATLTRIPLFSPPRPPGAAAAQGPAASTAAGEAVKLARLLAAF
jgi:hypothetical protein